MAIPDWINPPNYLAAMSSGANLGLNVRQQGFNERMSIEQLRQDQVRQALAAEQLRAAERRAIESDQLRELGLQIQNQRAQEVADMENAALSLQTRRQDFLESQAMDKAAQLPQMTPYQDAVISLRKAEMDAKAAKLPKPTVSPEVNFGLKLLASDSGLSREEKMNAGTALLRGLPLPPEPAPVPSAARVAYGKLANLAATDAAELAQGDARGGLFQHVERKKRLEETRRGMAELASQYPGLSPGSPADSSLSLPAALPQGRPLDIDTATSLLREAGGDKERARALARSRGFTIPGAAQSLAPPQSAERVRVVDPSGRTGTIPASQLDAALREGFQPAEPKLFYDRRTGTISTNRPPSTSSF